MGSDSKIEWTHHTFNPWIGCHKVSDGCKNCYAEELMDKRYGKAKWGVHGTRQRTSEDYWKQPLRWNRKAEKEGVRARVFCASLADAMEGREELQPIREDLYKLIKATPFLDWLLLTKRPENYIHFLPKHWLGDPRPNVWLGTSVENQQTAEERIPHLLNTPAVCRFLSMEPLLGAVDMTNLHYDGVTNIDALRGMHGVNSPLLGRCSYINWVIVGGESGRNARPMHPQWVRSIRGQCIEAGVPFFFKQWGEWARTYPVAGGDIGGDIRRGVVQALSLSGECNPGFGRKGDVYMRRVGKKQAGRLLDGQEWNEMPNQFNKQDRY